jgi:multiple sugar transport system permease protein
VVAGYLFALPFLVLFLVFTIGPVLASFVMSFTDLRASDVRNPLAVEPVGLAHYTDLLDDETFRQAAFNTAYFVVIGVPLTMGLALAVAVGLNSGITRLKAFFRVGYYLPVVTSIVAVAVVWRFLLEPDSGIVNTLLGYVGIDGPSWLNSTTWAMPSLIVMAAWRNMGYLVVIFLAGLQIVPREMHEAAAIDGAGAFKRFRYITLPLLRPLIAVQLLFGVIYATYQFAIPYVMFGSNPGPDADLMMTLIVRQSFSNNLFGFGSAVSVLLMMAMFVWVAIWYRAFKRDLEVA